MKPFRLFLTRTRCLSPALVLRLAFKPLTVLALAASGLTAQAATIEVPADTALQAVIDAAQAGDILMLAPGTYQGNIIVNKPLTLQGPSDRQAVLMGEREGRTVWVQAEDVQIRQITVRNSGLSLPDMDAGIFLDKPAHNALIENNDILDNLVGVYVWGPHNALVQHNTIVGNKELRLNERGNGVTVWNSPGSRILHNDISWGRDGIFSNTSRDNVFSHNRFTQLRYAVHYMYTNNSEVSSNVSIGNDIAYALMFSQFLTVRENISVNSTHQGLMLNAAQQSSITDNIVDGAEKGMFLYNANFNKIHGNLIQNTQIGVHYTAGSEGNEITENAFIQNQNQVKYVGTRYLEWSSNNRGNYWSDHSAFDLNGDGIGDTAYRPNGLIEQLVWRAPSARVLLNSPAVSIVRWAQTQFPAILPGGIIDSAPLMRAPVNPAWERYKASHDYKQ